MKDTPEWPAQATANAAILNHSLQLHANKNNATNMTATVLGYLHDDVMMCKKTIILELWEFGSFGVVCNVYVECM